MLQPLDRRQRAAPTAHCAPVHLTTDRKALPGGASRHFRLRRRKSGSRVRVKFLYTGNVITS